MYIKKITMICAKCGFITKKGKSFSDRPIRIGSFSICMKCGHGSVVVKIFDDGCVTYRDLNDEDWQNCNPSMKNYLKEVMNILREKYEKRIATDS